MQKADGAVGSAGRGGAGRGGDGQGWDGQGWDGQGWDGQGWDGQGGNGPGGDGRGDDGGWVDGGGWPTATPPVSVAECGQRPLRTPVRWVLIGLSMLLASGGVLVGSRFLADRDAAVSKTPPSVLDARSAPAAAGTGAVPGSTRLVPMRPAPAIDTRKGGPLRPGAEATGRLRNLAEGTSAVLLEVSVLAAAGPGEVVVDGGAGPGTVLRVLRKGAQTTTTAVVRIGPDRTVRARTPGGHLLVNLVGAFQPAEKSSAGRIVPVAAVQVLRLVPKTDGNTASIDVARLAALRRAGPISALLLQVSADVGNHGGLVEVGPSGGPPRQRVFWGATTGADRTRGGFLVVPVTGGSLRLTYHAGTEFRADLVGYVTGNGAPTTEAGLAVPVPPPPAQAVRIAPGDGADVQVVPGDLAGVPAGRVAATLVTVAATGDALGAVSVHTPGSRPPRNPTVVAARQVTRSALTLVGVADGRVRIDSRAGASVTATLRVLVLNAAR